MARRRKPRDRGVGLALAVAGAVALLALAFLAGGRLLHARRAVSRPVEAVHAPRASIHRHAGPPAVAAAEEPGTLPKPTGAARVALVIDDLGRSEREIDRLEGLHVPLTYAVLPYERRTAEIAERLRREGREVLCHLPMEPVGPQNPGPHAIVEPLDAPKIARLTREAIAAVPGAVGVNNHMGSRITADEHAMRAILGVVRDQRLFFLDSRTTAESRGLEIARELGVPATERSVFLDSERGEVPVTVAFHHLLTVAREKGAAVGIGHPHAATLRVLEELVPQAVAAGYEFVPVSRLLERDEAPPE